MTIKELLVLFKFDVDDASFAYAQSLLNKMEEKAGGLEQQSNKDDYFDGVGKGANKASLGVNALIGRMRMLAGLAGISLTVNGLIQTADQWRTIEGQVKNVIGEEENLEDIQERLYQVAGRTRQSYAQTAGLFTSVSRSASELGKSTDEILAFTEDVAMALRAGGGNADSQAAALVQLGQALGSGALRGDELNSILEQAPVLANTIAQGMGTSIGQLRRLGREGKITSAIIFESVRKMHDNLVKQTANAPFTVNAAFLRVRDAVSRVIYRLEKGFGVVNRIAEGIAGIADGIDKIEINDGVIAGMKMLAIWATVFWLATSAAVKVHVWDRLIAVLTTVCELYQILTASQLAFNLTMKSFWAAIAPAAILAAKILAIVTAITLLILAVEDLYQWLNGNDSLIGDWLGGMSGAERWSQWLTEFKKSMQQIGEFADWLFGHLDSDWAGFVAGAEKAGEIAFEMLMLPVTAIASLGRMIGEVFEGIAKFFGLENTNAFKTYFGNPSGISPSSLVTDGSSTTNNKSMTNSGNTTNNINITAPNGTAEAYAQAISNVLPGSPSYDFAMD